MYYTGIGSRTTPAPWLNLMVKLAQKLAKQGHTLRSGAAPGADSAFEQGCLAAGGKKEIYLPWSNFENRPTNQDGYFYTKDLDAAAYRKAEAFASQFHPAWERLSDAVKSLHTRNSHQVLGLDVKTPSKFLICWTLETGGTQQAIRIADYLEIPVFNFYHEDAAVKLKEFLAGISKH